MVADGTCTDEYDLGKSWISGTVIVIVVVFIVIVIASIVTILFVFIKPGNQKKKSEAKDLEV